jgi:hypothetical protein
MEIERERGRRSRGQRNKPGKENKKQTLVRVHRISALRKTKVTM